MSKEIISFPSSKTYELVRETNIHAHPIKVGFPSVCPEYMMIRAKGGISHDIFKVEAFIEVNPLDDFELSLYKEMPYWDRLSSYLYQRKNEFGFKSAPQYKYRFYVLNSVYKFNPVHITYPNTQSWQYVSWSDLMIDESELLLGKTKVGDKMGGKQPFSVNEAVLLLDAYLRTLNGEMTRVEAVKSCSKNLRKMAVNSGIKIDEVYRNVAGITFQMASMESAYKKMTIMKPATKLFNYVVDLYFNNRSEYDLLLMEAKKLAGIVSEKGSTASNELMNENIKDFEEVNKCFINMLDRITASDNRGYKDYSATVPGLFRLQVLINNSMKTIARIKLQKNVYVLVREEIAKACGFDYAMINYNLPAGTHFQYDEIESVINRIYEQYEKNDTLSKKNVLNEQIDSSEMMESLNRTIDYLSKRYDVRISYNHFIEPTNRSNDLLYKARYKNKDVMWIYYIQSKRSHYISVEIEPEYIVSIVDNIKGFTKSIQRSSHPRLKLFYDDYNKIKESLVMICDSIDEYFDNYNDNSFRNNKELKNDSFEESFYLWMKNEKGMADATCRGYVSAIHTAEYFAREHGYSESTICNESYEMVSQITSKLLSDDEFLLFNKTQHNRFTGAFKKLLEYYEAEGFNNIDSDYKELYPVLYEKLFAASKVYDDPNGFSLERICEIIGTEEKDEVEDLLSHVSWAKKLQDDAFSFSLVKKIESVETVIEPTDYDKERFIDILLRRYRYGMMFDSIDFDTFRDLYNDVYEEQLSFDDEELEVRLRFCGVFYNGRLFPVEGIMTDEIKTKLFDYIEKSFNSGKSVLYYKAIYEDMSDIFANCYSLTDDGMLKAYLEFVSEEDKYYFFKDYMTKERNVEIDHSSEVADYLLSIGRPVKVEDISKELSHIPQKQVSHIVTSNSLFQRNSTGEYFHVDIFEASEGELDKISDYIKYYIDLNEYAIWTDVWNDINEKMPVFIENNIYLSWLGIRNVVSKKLNNRYSFNGAVISLPQDKFEMSDIYRLYASHHPSFSAENIYNLSKELDTVIYFGAIYDVSVRVSHDLFVSKNNMDFNVDAIDKAIESFMTKDYIPIREIDSFLLFPNVGYEWNEYLLESYIYSFSKSFTLLNNGFSLNNVAGAIVKKEGKISEFVDVCGEVLADAHISLNKNEAINYLASINMITRRSYRDLEIAIQKATQIRGTKE